MAHGDGLGGRAQLVGAGGGVERLEHLELGELRQIFLRRIVERHLALLDELHGGYRGDRLGHRSDAEQRIELQRTSLADVGQPERALIDDAIAIGRHGDDAGDLLALDRAAQRGVDGLGLLRVGHEGKSH